MDAIELEMSANELLLKIHVITGWHIPPNEIMLLLVDQFKLKLLESYQNVNVDEFAYAFRHYSALVKEWGKSMNLVLVEQVMNEYLSHRFEVSRMEEQKPSNMIEEKKELTPDEWEQWLTETKDAFTAGNLSFALLPVPLYEFLEKSGRIDETKKKGFFGQAKELRIQKLRADLLEPTLKAEHKEFYERLQYITTGSKSISHPEYSTLATLAKRLMLKNYFNEK